MVATLIDGKAIAKATRGRIKEEVTQMKAAGITPGLAVILVGENPASITYVRSKERACEQAGIYSRVIRHPATITEAELLQEIQQLNEDPSIHGILVQLPLPPHISEDLVIEAIRVEKDVDGFHPINTGNLVVGKPGFVPCTPAGIMVMLEEMKIPIAGKHAVIVGRSNIVGKPMASLLLNQNATVTICHSKTVELGEITRQADILVAAVGKPNFISKAEVKPGAVVIDVGINRLPEGLVGDVNFEEVKEVASYITPVPGGVGPMTITMLLENTIQACKQLQG
ncbi:bifunctional methylenetetrahydrofolate dehydrogenase/methenyltetrahydrofolate cyclohydrolase FolD [Rubeoparvulum massiliense]|uniref:bifunctional methylenetetrahydrofolate dehydrogenase/methenyltetrahydrofolate cyclohydrolase FolD n=1 Tax=Rubeoparvulum massiliense TaxID=1631346 RepID=UPI00065E0D79|nr:bifunctional methylenetetrahydrofolate dehydrogenase/methenyltetrahydrofolate cyclohydrolase FolD [Rubeoparvulum massiliense]